MAQRMPPCWRKAKTIRQKAPNRAAEKRLVFDSRQLKTKGTTMKVIDAHAHIYPAKIADAAVHSISDFYGGVNVVHGGTAEDLLAAGKKAGVVRYLVFSCATSAKQVQSINNFIIGECQKHPEFIGVGTMHKGFEPYEEEIQRIYDQGLRGIKLHPDFQKFNLDDEDMFPIYAALEERGMFLISHIGDYRYGYSHPARLANLARRFPKMNFIGAHFAGWSLWNENRDYLNLPNVYMDTSSTMGFAGFEPARDAFKRFDHKHIFFATDFPMWDHSDELKLLAQLGLDDQTFEDVVYNNFAEFIGLDG